MLLINKMKIISIVLILTPHLCSVQGQTTCTTSTNSTGRCVSINECPELLEVDRKNQKTDEELKLLTDTQCGTNNMNLSTVCCPHNACFTPDANEGTCVNLHSCPILENLLAPPVTKQKYEFVRNHRCDDQDNSHVCCIDCHSIFGPPSSSSGCCGVSRSNARPDPDTIVTNVDQYPWMAIVESYNKYTKKTRMICGGVLISSKYVLSVGHCAISEGEKLIHVILGEYDYTSEGPDCVESKDGRQECTDGAISVPIEEVIVHQDYNITTFYRHDITLLRLQYNVPYTDFIRPICLPTSDVDESVQTFYIAGWGQKDPKHKSNVKLHVDLPLITNKVCQNIYYYIPIWKGHICAGGIEGRGACRGDSGGPLMVYNGRFFEVAGIVSLADPNCGIENNYIISTKVYQYLPWIRKHIKP